MEQAKPASHVEASAPHPEQTYDSAGEQEGTSKTTDLGPRYDAGQLLQLRPARDGTSDAVTANQPTLADAPDHSSDDKMPAKEFDAETKSQLGWRDDHADETVSAEVGELSQEVAQEEQPKKKKKKSKKKKVKPTGFEEYYADPPMTPEEHAEEMQEIYHHSRSFVERVQQCIQRYRARRNLDNERSHYFTQYLILGGIQTGVKQFTGGVLEDKETMEESTANEIEQYQAVDHIRSGSVKYYDPANDKHWVVHWEGVAKAFLSTKAPKIWGTEEYALNKYCNVVNNFLNYVLVHGVCPEYTQDILAARVVCDRAVAEWPAIAKLWTLLPGAFHKAAKTIYGPDGDDWTADDNPYEIDNRRNFDEEAVRVVGPAVLSMTGYACNLKQEISPTLRKEHVSVEILKIVEPDEWAVQFYKHMADEEGRDRLVVLGKVIVRHWDDPELGEPDISDDEEEAQPYKRATLEEFWFEEEILDQFHPFMKFTADVTTHSSGWKYISKFTGIFPSFHAYLPIQRLERYKEPKPNYRPGPTVDDLDPVDGQQEEYDDEEDEIEA